VASTKQLHIEWSVTTSSFSYESTRVLLHVVKTCCSHLGDHLVYIKDKIKCCLLVTQTMRDVEGERLAVAFKLRSPDTALLDFHMALTAAGKQFEPRCMSMLHRQNYYSDMILACHQLDNFACLLDVHDRASCVSAAISSTALCGICLGLPYGVRCMKADSSLKTNESFCVRRFAGPIRVIELLAMFDEMHASINNAGSSQSLKVASFSLVSVCSPSLKPIHGIFEVVYMICTVCHTGALSTCTHVSCLGLIKFTVPAQLRHVCLKLCSDTMYVTQLACDTQGEQALTVSTPELQSELHNQHAPKQAARHSQVPDTAEDIRRHAAEQKYRPDMRIFIKSLTGRTCSLTVHKSWDIWAVKSLFETVEGVPPHMQRLIFAGRQLEDKSLLSDSDVRHDSTLHLVQRLAGD